MSRFLSNQTTYTLVRCLVTTAEAADRNIGSQSKKHLRLIANEPEVQEALAIVDTVLRRRGYEPHKNRNPLGTSYMLSDSKSGWENCSFGYWQRKQTKMGTLWIRLERSQWCIGPGEEAKQARDEIYDELVKRFGKERVSKMGNL